MECYSNKRNFLTSARELHHWPTNYTQLVSAACTSSYATYSSTTACLIFFVLPKSKKAKKKTNL